MTDEVSSQDGEGSGPRRERPPRNLTGWARAAAIGNVAVALVLVVGGIASAYVVVENYFAKQSTMDGVTCMLDQRSELFQLQIESGNVYARYVNTKVNLEQIRRQKPEAVAEIARQEGKREALWAQLDTLNRKAVDLADQIKQAECRRVFKEWSRP